MAKAPTQKQKNQKKTKNYVKGTKTLAEELISNLPKTKTKAKEQSRDQNRAKEGSQRQQQSINIIETVETSSSIFCIENIDNVIWRL